MAETNSNVPEPVEVQLKKLHHLMHFHRDTLIELGLLYGTIHIILGRLYKASLLKEGVPKEAIEKLHKASSDVENLLKSLKSMEEDKA